MENVKGHALQISNTTITTTLIDKITIFLN
jgi:hypothetical protein